MHNNLRSLRKSAVEEMTDNPYNLLGKTILITGASSGIGRAVAVECSKMGATAFILVGRNKEALDETASLMDGSCSAKTICCDISDKPTLEKFIEELPLIDGFVCNAGINKMKPVQFYSVSDIESVFDINCIAPMLMVKMLVRKKKFRQYASVVFTSSISGFSNVSVGNGIYGASKGALTSFMKYAALELSPRNIRCNAVHPGRVETPLIYNSMIGDDVLKKDIEKYPLRRYGKPEEVAYAIIYFLSDAASWVTGTSLVVDGGRSLV